MIIDSFTGKYGFLSNFYENGFHWNGEYARTSEHHFQAAKTLDETEAFRIRTASKPGVAKERGQKCTRREDWDEVKVETMRSILKAKFEVSQMRYRLELTGDAELVEGNTHGDTFWGVCNGKGENHLGKLLVEVREFYRNQP